MNEKPIVAAIVQARMGSERFPGKVMKKIYRDKTVLDMVYTRLKSCDLIDKVIIATSTAQQDDQIVKHCKEQGYQVFRGPEDDVAQRMLLASEYADCDIIVDVTSDCPLIDENIVIHCISKLINNNLDYCSNVMIREFPDGLDVQVYTYAAFVKLVSKYEINSTHTGINFIPYQKEFKTQHISPPNSHYRHPEWELTIDYPEDLELIRILAAWQMEIDVDDVFGLLAWFSTTNALQLLEQFPALLKINAKLPRKKESNNKAEVLA